MSFHLSHLLQNTVLVGLVGAMLTGSVLWLLRAIPKIAWQWLERATTVTVVIPSEDDAFEWVTHWLAQHPYAARASRLKVTTRHRDSDWKMAPGVGLHLLWDGYIPIFVERVEDSPAGKGNERAAEKYFLTTFGRSQSRLRALIENANELRQRSDKLEIRLWQHHYWQTVARRAKRPLNSLFLPNGMLDAMLKEADWFFSSASWHIALGIPYRLGWMFLGSPGTGKTTAALALASHFDRPIYVLNLATMPNDNVLQEAFSSADPRCILLLEDIDAVDVTHQRQPVEAGSEEKRGITLSGLLNAIDGVASADGRLLIMTTNHPECLDAALTRSGRVDSRWSFLPISPALTHDMVLRFHRFHPDRSDLAQQAALESAQRPGLTASDWQAALVKSRKDPDSLVSLLRTK